MLDQLFSKLSDTQKPFFERLKMSRFMLNGSPDRASLNEAGLQYMWHSSLASIYKLKNDFLTTPRAAADEASAHHERAFRRRPREVTLSIVPEKI